MRAAHNHHVIDPGERANRRFDRTGIEVHAPADDHVVAPPEHVELAGNDAAPISRNQATTRRTWTGHNQR